MKLPFSRTQYTIATAVLLLAVAIVFSLFSPVITGKTTYQNQEVATQNLALLFSNGDDYALSVPGQLIGMQASGYVIGEGAVELILTNETHNWTVYRSDTTIISRVTGLVIQDAGLMNVTVSNVTNASQEEVLPEGAIITRIPLLVEEQEEVVAQVSELIVAVNDTNTTAPVEETVEVNQVNETPEVNITNRTQVPVVNTTTVTVEVNETTLSNVTTNVSENQTVNETIVNITTPINTTNVTVNETSNLSANLTINQTVNDTNVTVITNETVNQTVNETVVNETEIEHQTNITIPSINETIVMNQTENITTNETVLEVRKQFIMQCKDTCNLPKLTGDLRLVVNASENVTLYVEDIFYIHRYPIMQLYNISNQSLLPNETVRIDLLRHFAAKPTLVFDLPQVSGFSAAIIDETYLDITADVGKYELFVYATDGDELHRTNTFSILVANPQINQTLNLTNETLNQTNLTFNPLENLTPQQLALYEKILQEGSLRVLLDNPGSSLRSQVTSRTVPVAVRRNAAQGLPEQSALARKPELFLELPSAALPVKQHLGTTLAVEVTAEEYLALIQEASSVVEDTLISPLALQSTQLTKTTSAHLQGLGGAGQRICIVDTGANYPSLSINTLAALNVFDNSTIITDNHGHGTNVLTIAGTFAPNADYIIVKAINDTGYGYASDVIAGLEFCQDRNADIISLSIGGGSFSGYCDQDAVAQTVNDLVDTGITVFAATGNDGSSTAITSPACASKAIPVAASTKQYSLASFSNYNNATLLLAPGQTIETLDNNSQLVNVSGTSMSTPMIAAATALLFENRSFANFSEVEKHLIQTGDIIVAPTRDFVQLNMFNALTNNFTNNLSRGNVLFVNGSVQNVSVLAAPLNGTVSLSDTGFVYAHENITRTYQHVYDPDGDPIFNSTDWRINGQSLAIVNLPFNDNISSASASLIDYSNAGVNSFLGSTPPVLTDSADNFHGYYYYFTGTSRTINFDRPLIPPGVHTKPWSLSVWYKPTSFGDAGRFFRQAANADGLQFEIQVSTSGTVRVIHNSNIIYASPSLSLGNWSLITLTQNGSLYKMYINGNYTGNFTGLGFGPYPYNYSSANSTLGIPAYNWAFKLDNFLFFNYTLSDDQISQLYLDGKNNEPWSTLTADQTTEGDNVTVVVTPHDFSASGTSDSTSVEVIDIRVQNATLLPSVVYENGSLQGYCAASNGAGDNVSYYWKWYVDDVLNSSGSHVSSGYCYQETTNASHASDGSCTLDYSGSYSTSGAAWGSLSNGYDGDWSTSMSPNFFGTSYFYMVYMKPAGATNNSLIQLKGAISIDNHTIPSSCWNWGSNLSFRIDGDGMSSNGNMHCYNGTSYVTVTSWSTGTEIYEEAMFWDVDTLQSFTEDTSVNVENVTVSSAYEEWIISCLATDGTTNSSWLNSTATTVQPFLSIVLNATSVANTSFDNLTATFSAAGSSDGVLDWRLNGTSIALLNMPFDINNTNRSVPVKDYSTFEHNGTLGEVSDNQVPEWRSGADCMVGGCYYFDGEGGAADDSPVDFIDLGDTSAFEGLSDFTIALWARQEGNSSDFAAPHYGTLLSKSFYPSTEFQLLLINGLYGDLGGVFFSMNGSGLSYTVNTSEWNHYVIVLDLEEYALSLWVNGELVNTTSYVNPLPGTSARLMIGASDKFLIYSPSAAFNGSIDEVYIFNRSLGSLYGIAPEWSTIPLLYEAGLAGKSLDSISLLETVIGDNWSVMYSYQNSTVEDSVLSNSVEILAECSQNSDCTTGEYCSIGFGVPYLTQVCQPQLADGETCQGMTYLATQAEEDGACSSGYCDSDGVGAADDGWCFTPSSVYFDGEESTMCEYSATAAVNISADEKDADSCDGTSGYVTADCNYQDEADVSADACGCIDGANNWNLGGDTSPTTCCDDAGEYNLTSTLHGGMAAIGDVTACCDAATDCAVGTSCVATTSTSTDADGDGDNDYCLSGTWYDCSTSAQCGAGYVCTSNACVATRGRLTITTAGGVASAIIDKVGTMLIAGTVTQSCVTAPNGGDYVIRTTSGVAAWFDDATGNLCLTGSLSEDVTSFPTPSGDDWIVQNVNGTTVVFVDGGTGNMYVRRKIIESAVI